MNTEIMPAQTMNDVGQPSVRFNLPPRWATTILRFIVNVIFALLSRRRVSGLHHLPVTGPCLLVFNHLSQIDGPLIFSILPRRDFSSLIAVEFRRPIYRTLLETGGGIWLRRGEGDRAALKLALALLGHGRVVALAPEGRISPTGALIAAQRGPAFLAVHANVPIVPVALINTEHAVATLKRFRRPVLTVRFGEPFTIPTLASGQRKQQLESATEEMMCHLAALLPPKYRGFYADCPEK